MEFQQKHRARNAARMLSHAVLLMGIVTSTLAQSACAESGLQPPSQRPTPRASRTYTVPDELLVMASGTAEQDDFLTAVKEANGTVVRIIGEGPMTVYVVHTEKGKLDQTEKKLSKDNDVAMVQRNFLLKPQGYPNDPYYPSQWNLPAMNVPKAWALSKGGRQTIAIVDTGKNARAKDLTTSAGYDAVRRVNGQKPFGDHGMMVATVAAARTNNGINTASVAPVASVYPVKVCDDAGNISMSAIIEAIYQCGNKNFRILNLSINAPPPYSLSNAQAHPVFHSYADWYHNQKNGLLFVAAGNDGTEDTAPFNRNIIVVSALTVQKAFAPFSNYGNNLWFTAPGQDMYCTNTKGQVVSVSGTSFSTPCVAGVAALVWAARPTLKNTDVERIMAGTAYKVPGQPYSKYFGFGLPNAEAAVKAAKAGTIP